MASAAAGAFPLAAGRARGKRILVVGGGIVGLATALKLRRVVRGSSIVVLEKEPAVAMHQSGHNSGVLHAGVYYRPGSFKARLAVAGIREMTAFCARYAVPHEVCGKLIVATDATERERLTALAQRGRSNGLRGLRILSREEMREIEPEVGGIAALHVPEEGIVDYPAVCRVLVRLVTDGGGRVVTGARVDRLLRRGGAWVALTSAGDFEGDFVVGCAGLHADRVARAAGLRTPLRIVPFRGEYYFLRPESAGLVRNLIYPVPDPSFPFLGVHFTRRIGGGVEAGPNAVLALSREGYRRGRPDPADVAEILTFPGFWRFLARHPRASWMEIRRSYSRRLFVRALERLLPRLEDADLRPGGAGVRAQAMSRDGRLLDDFAFGSAPGALFVLNAPSPAATASLAIGQEVASRVAAQMASSSGAAM
jgi:(S)-2-hydroxyglutarate dehydrogenase